MVFKFAIEGNEVTEQEFCMMLNRPHDLVIDCTNSFKSIYPSTNNNFTIYGTYNDYEVTCEDCTNCINCYHCVECENCRGCVDCDECSYCNDCKLCHECTYCTECKSCNDCSYCSSSMNSIRCTYCSYVINTRTCDFCTKCNDCIDGEHLEKCKLCTNNAYMCDCIDCKYCRYCSGCDSCLNVYNAFVSSKCSYCNYITDCCLCNESKYVNECYLCDRVEMSEDLLMSDHSLYSRESSLLSNSEFCSKINNNVYNDDIIRTLNKTMSTYVEKNNTRVLNCDVDSVTWFNNPSATLFLNTRDKRIRDYLPELFEYLFDQTTEIPSELQACLLPDFNSFVTTIKSKKNMTCDKCYYCSQLTNKSNCKFCTQ